MIGTGEDVGYPQSLLMIYYKYIWYGGDWRVEVIPLYP